MQFSKIFISFFLLFVYTAGVAHELIPHHQDEVKEVCEFTAENSHESNHDTECGELTCFTHTDHCDDGLVDLLSCLFSDENHPDDDCTNEVYLPSSSHNMDMDTFSKVKLTSVFVTVFQLIPVQNTPTFYGFEIPDWYASPPIQNSSNRGPPVV